MQVLRGVGAVLAGLAIGSGVNMGVVVLGQTLVPLPEGVDLSSPESAQAAMDQMRAVHFLPPLMAHALGTLVGALIAALIAGPKLKLAPWVVGGFFLLGGIAMAFAIPAPLWFLVLDLGGAYVPMALLGSRLARGLRRRRARSQDNAV